MAATKNTSDSLKVLMAAALALPGMAAQAADPNVRNDSIVLSYNHAKYSEDHNRMDIDVDQLSLTVPLGDRYEVKLNTIQDKTSGASPFANRVVSGQPVMILATAASIRDTRRVADLTGAYYGDEFRADVNIGKSIENDYIAKFISTNYSRYLNDKATQVSVGVAYSDDTVWDKWYNIPNARPSVYRGRHKHDLVLGLSQVLDKNSVLQVSLAHGYSFGHLGDQYRRATVFNGKVPGFIPDTRPDNRTQWTAVARYSRYFDAINSGLHLDYRYSKDSWDADSHTVEGKLRTSLGGGFFVAPGLRYYTQKHAHFYDLFFSKMPDNKLVSSDYRLSTFGAITPKLELVKTFKNGFLARASFEQYDRKYSLGKSGGRGSKIDDYKARMLSLSVEAGF